ncbi:MAG TPA: type II toxin-antitoxin system PemK/MazF family toxin [Lutibacter sp.]|nr:type II toxin-antitoxin system PemK/MazF family toxin [Lutibacter sp.]
MKQAEIWEMYFNPIKGSEQSGRRPAVIISGNALNDNLNDVIVCPLTTKIKGFKGNIILQPNINNKLQKESEVLTFHIRSVSKERLKKKLGVISKIELNQIKKTLNDLLKY